MMRTILTAVLLLGCAGCTTNSGPIEIIAFRPIDRENGCASYTDDDVFMDNGSVDVASGRPSYFLTAHISGGQNLVVAPIVRSDGRVLDSTTRDSAVIEQIEFKYRTTPSIGTIRDEVVPVYAVIGGEAGELFYSMNMIRPTAAEVLRSLSATADPQERLTTLFVTVTLKGRLMRSKTAFSTGPATFPIFVYKSSTTCDPSLGYAADSCGVSGQDSSAACCVAGQTGCVFPPP